MEDQKYTSGQLYALIALRLLVGWYFLYEGVVKLYNSTWKAKGYLLSASILKPFFGWLACGAMSSVADVLNIGALVIVGVSLLLGFKTKWAVLLASAC